MASALALYFHHPSPVLLQLLNTSSHTCSIACTCVHCTMPAYAIMAHVTFESMPYAARYIPRLSRTRAVSNSGNSTVLLHGAWLVACESARAVYTYFVLNMITTARRMQPAVSRQLVAHTQYSACESETYYLTSMSCAQSTRWQHAPTQRTRPSAVTSSVGYTKPVRACRHWERKGLGRIGLHGS